MTDSTAVPAPPLRIDDLIGGHLVIWPGDQLTVGRSGDFLVGQDDRYLHRILFQLWHSGHGWMITNRGSTIPLTLEVRGAKSLSKTDLGPGGVMPVPSGSSVITFATKERAYELNLDIPVGGMIRPSAPPPVNPLEPTFARHDLNLEQDQLLAALAEPLLARPGATNADVPRPSEVAERLGWTAKKTERKIDTLYEKLESYGERVYKPKHLFLAHYATRYTGRGSQ